MVNVSKNWFSNLAFQECSQEREKEDERNEQRGEEEGKNRAELHLYTCFFYILKINAVFTKGAN